MAKIVAQGVPVKYRRIGEIRITVEGTDVDIKDMTFEKKDAKTGQYVPDESLELLFYEDMKRGPTYPLCADPDTMRCALFVLYEWYDEQNAFRRGEKHVAVEGEIEPMPYEPGVVY